MSENNDRPGLGERLARAWATFRGTEAQAEDRITGPEQLAKAIGRGHTATSGAPVNQETAMRVSAVHACVKVISEDLGSLPLHVYRNLKPRGKERAAQHPVYKLLHDRPNEWQTAMEFREMMQGHLLLRGNAYAKKAYVRGRLDELIPLHPDRVAVKVDKYGTITYEVLPLIGYGEPRVYGRKEIFHIRGLSSNGFVGRSPIADARDAIGLAFTQEEYAGEAYRDGGLQRIALEHPAKLSDKAAAKLRDSWSEIYGGSNKHARPAVLEEGMKASKLGLTAKDLQFIEGRKFQIEDIARFFRVPLHKIGDLDRATNNNIEQQALDYVVSTLMPWCVRWEQAVQRDLLDQPGDEEYFAKHAVDGLLRGDPEKRHKSYAVGRQWGYLNADEIRELEDMNPLPNGLGQKYWVPSNMRNADEPAPAPGATPQPQETPDA